MPSVMTPRPAWTTALATLVLSFPLHADLFVDATADVGLDFTHFNGMSGERYMPENMGAGGALVDYDGDGDLDVYLVQGRMLGPGKKTADALFPPRHPEPLTDRLYRNELVETGTLRFTDVSAGLTALSSTGGYGMGVAAGDYDNDGRVDLYVTAFGANRLLRNLGNGRFEDVTGRAGVGEERWSVPAVFFDFDRDGRLDLFVGNYLDFAYERHRPCTTKAGAPDYCDPDVYAGVPDRLFRNRRDGTFADVTASSGLGAAAGKALGVVAADLDGDGWIDLYVANDGVPNQLWLNRHDGTFRDEALPAGCAVNGEGLSEASMGADAADYDGDGDLDLFLTHFTGETHTLYRNEGKGIFEDVTAAAGLAAPTLDATGFGTRFVDADGDGVLDLVAVNGAVRAIEALARSGDPYPLHQPNHFFRGLGGGRFAAADGGAVFVRSEVSRGALFGDLDDDGDVDVVVTNNSGPARVWLDAGRDSRWLGLRLVVGEPPRDAVGATVELLRPRRLGRVAADGSYASASDPRVVFALGREAPPHLAVRVVWPDGSAQTWESVPVGRYTTLRQGTSAPQSSP